MMTVQAHKNPSYSPSPRKFIRVLHEPHASWEQVRLKHLKEEIQHFKNEKGFVQIAKDLGSRASGCSTHGRGAASQDQ